MKHRNLTTENWTKMAIDSLFERGKLPDWKEFVVVLAKDKALAQETVAVCRYHKNRASVNLAMVFVEQYYPDIALAP